jgi:hypothetical protein
MMKKAQLQKLVLGYSELTNRIYLYEPYPNGDVKGDKVDVTEQFEFIQRKAKNVLKSIVGNDEYR